MSEAVEQAMDRLLGSPTTCPHGNPIPGSKYVEGKSRAARRRHRRRGVHDQPDHRGARVHARPARVPRGQRAAAGQRGHDHRGVARRHAHRRDRRQARRRRRVRQRPHPGRRVTRRARGPVLTAVAAVVVAGALSSCATTYDTSATTVASAPDDDRVRGDRVDRRAAGGDLDGGRRGSARSSSTTTASAMPWPGSRRSGPSCARRSPPTAPSCSTGSTRRSPRSAARWSAAVRPTPTRRPRT